MNICITWMKIPQWNFHVKVIILHEQNHQSRCTAQSTAKGVFTAREWTRLELSAGECVCVCSYVCLCYVHVYVFGEKVAGMGRGEEDDKTEK